MKSSRATSTLLRSNGALPQYILGRYSNSYQATITPSSTVARLSTTSTARTPARPVCAGQSTCPHGTPPVLARKFSATPASLKKGRDKDADSNNKKQKKQGSSSSSSSSSSTKAEDHDESGSGRPKPDAEDPFNMADLNWGWDRLARRQEEALRAVRAGGKFSAEAIGAVPVRASGNNKTAAAAAAAATVPLRELATVQPKTARKWSILCFDAGSKKAIKSAIQSHPDFNQQPQDAPDNESELVIAVEPERAEALEKRVEAACHQWREGIRAERSKRDRVAKQWRADNVLSADAKRKMDTTLQKLQDERMAVVDRKEAEAKRSIRSTEW